MTLFASSAQLSSPNHKLPSARLSSAHQFQENSGSAQLELEKNPARSTSTVEDILKMIEILAPLSPRKYLLHQAAKDGSVGIVKILVKHLDANVKDFNGLLPIDYALRKNDIEAIKILFPYTKELRTDYYIHKHNSNSKAKDLLKSLIEERNDGKSKD